MRNGKKSLTVNIIAIFLIFNILSVMIFTVYMQKNGKKESFAYARSNLLEVTKEKSELLAITFDRIRNRAETVGLYMEDVLRQGSSGTLGKEYTEDENGTLVRKKDSSRAAHQQSNIIVPALTPVSEELIREINMTEILDRYFAQIIENEEVSWCYIVTKENLLRCSPYRNLNEFFTSDHSQVSDIFYTRATDQNNPEHGSVWTEPYYDYLGTGWTMTCSQPVYDEQDDLFGVICLDLSIEKVKEKYFESFSMGETGKLCWMSSSGQVYYHSDYDQMTAAQGETMEMNIFDEKLSAGRKKAIQEGVLSGTSGIEYFEEDGRDNMLIYAQVTGTDSVLFMEIGMEEFASIYSVSLKGVLVVVLINLILAVMFAVILYYSFSKPMKRLVGQAQRISEGNYSEIYFRKQENSRYYEFGRLNEALCVMNENIVSYTESLRDKTREIQVILEAIDETLMIMNPDGTVKVKSRDFLAIPEDNLKRCIAKVCEEEQPFEEQVIAGGEVYKNVYYPIMKDHCVVKIVVSSECITQKILMEKELQQIEKMAGVGQLAAALVHELKNILARIRGAAYILNMTDSSDPQEVRTIQNAVNEAENLITTLLDFSARDKNGSEMIHLGTLINQILLLSGKELIGKGITVEKNIEETCYVNSNGREALKVILQNIICNAIQAVDCEGHISISCGTESGQAVVRIRDNGEGIQVFPKEKIFEPFLTTKEDGNGIGLWITKRLVDSMEGTVTVTEVSGGGTEFMVTIPVDGKEVCDCDTDHAGR